MSTQKVIGSDYEPLIPANDLAYVELSIVIPALNEEATVGTFVDWCNEGIKRIDIPTEILIIDSSDDKTAEIALSKGARVLKVPRLGLGRAYIDALPHIRGKYTILGDCDCTYDFRELKPFVDKFKQGYEFIMGSRFAGSIEPGAMPLLHQYFGSPATTYFFDVIFNQKFSDIHCGMRGVTLDGLKRMQLKSQSWQYASEMIIKAIYLELKITEIPIKFYKDINGRVSHHKRRGFAEPWIAGWYTLKNTFVYRTDFFLISPGFICFALGLALVLLLAGGEKVVGGLGFSFYWQMLGAFLSVLGAHLIFSGVLARILYDFHGDTTKKWVAIFPYNRSIVISMILITIGLAAVFPFLRDYFVNDFRLPSNPSSGHLAITGMVFIVLSFINFTSTLLIHAASLSKDTKHDFS